MACKVCDKNSGYYPLCKNCYSEKENIKHNIEQDDDYKTIKDLRRAYFIYIKYATKERKKEKNQETIEETILNLIAINEIFQQNNHYCLENRLDKDIKTLKSFINITKEKISIKTIDKQKEINFIDNLIQSSVNDNEDYVKKINQLLEFRKKNQAKILCEDGHKVRSRAEKIIDDFFSLRDIKHNYETKVPIDEIMYCDFYLPKCDCILSIGV